MINFNKYRGEQGAVAIIVALLSFSLIGFTAIAVDVGYLYEVKRQVQAAADAGALSAAQEMITNEDTAAVTDEAEEYVTKNDFKPNTMGDPVRMTAISIVPGEYVEVTASKRVPLFFARIFDVADADLAAKARAQIVYLTGGHGLVPWGAPIINANKVTAEVIGSGSGEVELTKNSDSGKWEDNVPVPSATSNSGYPVRIKAYNQQFTEDNPDGYPETIENASYVVKNYGAVTDAYFTDHDSFVEDKGSSTVGLYISTTSGSPSVRFNGKNYNNFASLGSGLYKVNLPLPATTMPKEIFPVDINSPASISNALSLVVRRTGYPINQYETSGDFNPGSQVSIKVSINDYKPGILYDLKVSSGGETGNFMALDFRYIFHNPYTGPSEGLNDSAADYYDNLIGYEGEIHIDDIVQTKTGNLSSPETQKRLEKRFGSCLNETYEQWLAAGEPANCGRLVFVPIVEKIDRQNGTSEVKVVSFGAFYVANIDFKNSNIRGYFVENMGSPSSYSEEAPEGNLVLKTVRLVAPE